MYLAYRTSEEDDGNEMLIYPSDYCLLRHHFQTAYKNHHGSGVLIFFFFEEHL